MNRPSQRELFAQRPVRSDFARRKGGGADFNPRKLLLITALIVVAVGIGLAVNMFGGGESTIEEIPTLQAEMPIKQRPEQPGGIDIPHQDVAVFQKLDGGAQGENKPDVEHLLPGPEEPKEPAPIVPASPQPEVASAPEAAPVQAAPAQEELPPAITAAAPEPAKAAEPVAEPAAVTQAKPEPVVKTEEPKPEVKKAEVKEINKPTAVIKEKAATVSNAESKKAEAAMARLPKELFTNDSFAPAPASTDSAPAQPAVAEPEPVSTPAPVAAKTATVTASSGKASVQFASVQDQAQAEKSLSKFQSKYAGILGGATLRVVRVDLGAKGIYYRVMTAPVNESKAKAICADVVKQKGSCVVVK